MIGNRYTGFDLDNLRDWLAARASSDGSVDLRSDLPDALRDAWYPDQNEAKTKLDVWPLGDCRAWINSDGDVRIDYGAQVFSEKGGDGLFRRRLDTATGRVTHSRYELPEEEWGQGHGKRLMRRSVEIYLCLGLKSIDVTAVGIGKYLWPMCGFSTDPPALKADAPNAADAEHWKTVDAMAKFFADLGYTDDFPRYDELWQYPASLDFDTFGNEVLVSRSAIIDAFAKAGRSFKDAALPEPLQPTIAVSKALMIYSTTQLWPGSFRLDGWASNPTENEQIARLCLYTQNV